jgi:uncharacterized repeat protein (TIGR01451 family)
MKVSATFVRLVAPLKGGFMKLGIMKFVRVAAIAALMVVVGSTTAWAQQPPCPASPHFVPDFSSNQNCLTLNDSASIVVTEGSAQITGWSGSEGIVTFTAPNTFTAGQPITLSGFTTTPSFNGLTFQVLSSGLTGTAFAVASRITGSATEAGVATPTTVLRLTPNDLYQTGSAWFNQRQPVANTFSTTFSFRLNNPSQSGNADGIAFLIQNSEAGTHAIDDHFNENFETGTDGCSIGYGQSNTSDNCTSSTGGIPNSLAVEFDTFQNGHDPNGNHVAIQSCGTAPNSSDHLVPGTQTPTPCNLAINLLDPQVAINPTTGMPIILADGSIHSVTITYTASSTCGLEQTCSSLDVILDGFDLFPGGVLVDLNTLGLNEGNAYVGFTAATGGATDNQDILSWTFTQQSQSAVVTPGAETPTFFNFAGGPNAGGYNASVLLAANSAAETVQVSPTLISQADCNAIVNRTFPGAKCFVYDNAGQPTSVLFTYTCPGSETGGTCGSDALANFNATLGSDFSFQLATNVGFPLLTSPPLSYLPEVGFLKGSGPDPLQACAFSDPNQLVFSSNQITSFSKQGDPIGSGRAGSGGTGSCWVLTYNTPNEDPSVNIVAPANGGTYQQNAATSANYSCNAVNANTNHPNSPTGPYLTASCSATNSVGGSVGNGAQFDTATLGPHTFTATAVDSATNSVSKTATYNVVAATDVAIANVAASKASTGSKLTYLIGVGDLGSANAVNVTVTDTLAPGTSFFSASGSNVSIVTTCATVNGKKTCTTNKTTTPITCTPAGNTVSCFVGTIMPLSLSNLNGAAIAITVNLTTPGTKQNVATVVASNADGKLSNNSSTATTTVK